MTFGWLVGGWVGGSTYVNKIPVHFHHKVHNFKFLLQSTWKTKLMSMKQRIKEKYQTW